VWVACVLVTVLPVRNNKSSHSKNDNEWSSVKVVISDILLTFFLGGYLWCLVFHITQIMMKLFIRKTWLFQILSVKKDNVISTYLYFTLNN